MKITSHFIPICLLALAFLSCNNATPAGFWKNFKPSFSMESISDQGTDGGHRAIYWKAKTTNTFNSREAIRFARENGWKVVDSLEFESRETRNWYYFNKPIFPLSYAGFSSMPSNNSDYLFFPRWIDTAVKVYGFKTGWVSIEPGTGKVTEVNGFILINNEGTQMSVYHLWGD